MARDAALGVLWLHESTPTFIHRDLKTSNLLGNADIDSFYLLPKLLFTVDENMRVKICDFGLSTVKPQRHQMLKDQTTAKGTPLFMAPEVMMFREFNESSDVYSFGIVLWEVCYSVLLGSFKILWFILCSDFDPARAIQSIQSIRRIQDSCLRAT